MSIARDVIPQQILGSCADCQSASLSFPKSAYSCLKSAYSCLKPAYSCLNLHKEAYFSSKTCVYQKKVVSNPPPFIVHFCRVIATIILVLFTATSIFVPFAGFNPALSSFFFRPLSGMICRLFHSLAPIA